MIPTKEGFSSHFNMKYFKKANNLAHTTLYELDHKKALKGTRALQKIIQICQFVY